MSHASSAPLCTFSEALNDAIRSWRPLAVAANRLAAQSLDVHRENVRLRKALLMQEAAQEAQRGADIFARWGANVRCSSKCCFGPKLVQNDYLSTKFDATDAEKREE